MLLCAIYHPALQFSLPPAFSLGDPFQHILFIAELSFQKSVLIKIFFYLQLGRSAQIRPKHLLFPLLEEISTECNWVTTRPGVSLPGHRCKQMNTFKYFAGITTTEHKITLLYVSAESQAATWTQNSVFLQLSLYIYPIDSKIKENKTQHNNPPNRTTN